MNENKPNENQLPKFESVEALTEWFDNHDISQYLDEMPKVHFDVDIQRRTFLVSVDQQIMKKLIGIAKAQHTSTEQLINSWLEEKVARAA